jgi:putative Ca2+/H+ antiporter (TMEM165/GDT1 family)
VVFLGKAAAARLPIRLMNLLAAAVFVALGVRALLGHGALA